MEEKITVDNHAEVTELQQKIAEYEAQVKNLKSTLSERNSEAAQKKREAEEWKTKYNATLSEQEKAEAERAEAQKIKDEQFNELLRKSNISDYKARYLALGYTEDLAQSSAEAKVDGNEELVFQNEAKFMQMRDERIKAEILAAQPKLTPGKTPEADENARDFAEMKKWANI